MEESQISSMLPTSLEKIDSAISVTRISIIKTYFRVQDRLGRVFREGLLKAAQTTGAWIITAGLDAGVVKHVATALDEAGISARLVRFRVY